jgi:hypothetical protein
VAAVVTERPQSLFDDRSPDGGIFFQPLGDGGLERIELADALPSSGALCRRIQVLPDGVPAHAEMTFDLADRPALGPIETMQIVELFGGEHGAILFYPAETAGAPGRCCWQDSETGGLRGGSASRIQTCAGAELLLARCSRSDPSSQTSAAERFRSKAELLFARSRRRRFWSPTSCRWRLRATAVGCWSR